VTEPQPPGDIVRAHLAEQDITHTEAARRIGTWPNHFNRIVNSRIQITAKVAFRLQRETGLDALHVLTAQSRWQLHHLAAGTWPYEARKQPRPADEEEL
jgi:plasmid maintenance system antidote protein VapI